MVIQCPDCRTRFKVADEKLKPEGIKVRCARCKRVFAVVPSQPEASRPAEEAAEGVSQKVASPVTVAETPPETASSGDRPAIGVEGEEKAFFSDVEGEDLRLGGGHADSRDDAYDFGEIPSTGSEPSDPLGEEEFPADDLAFDDLKTDTKEGADEGTFALKEEDDFGFDIDSKSGDLFGKEFQEMAEPGGAAEKLLEKEDDYFSFDAPSQENEKTADSSSPFAAAESADEFSFTAENESSDSNLEWGQVEDAKESDRFTAAPAATGGHDEFDFRDATFPEESPVPPPAPAAVAPTPVSAAPPVTPPIQEEIKPQPRPATEKTQAEKKPSATPVKHRRKSSVSRLTLFLILLLAAVAGGAVYFFQQGGAESIGNALDRYTNPQPPPPAPSQIRLTNLRGFFVQNNREGQIFAISGEAVNDHPSARSAISVKGILYDDKGKALLQQTVFAGNPLTEENLRNLPFSKMEERMNNQFGDSLSNLNVASGKSIPFTVVFKGLPSNLAEFTVEVADSKPGSK